MDNTAIAVFLSFVLYFLYVLLPMVPAIVIYRMFPDTKVGVKGPLGSLTINATGAFAAYVITVILGYFLVQNTHNLIGDMVIPTWKIMAKVSLQESENKPISNPGKILNALNVTFKPELHTIEGEYVDLMIPVIKHDLPFIKFSVQNFGERTINLNGMDKKKVKRDEFNKVIEILDPIVITKSEAVAEPYKIKERLKQETDPSKGPPVNLIDKEIE